MQMSTNQRISENNQLLSGRKTCQRVKTWGRLLYRKAWTGGKPPVNFPSWFPSAHPWLTLIIHSHLIESYRVYLSPWHWRWTYPTSPMSTENSQPLHDHEGTLCRKVVTWVKLEGWSNSWTPSGYGQPHVWHNYDITSLWFQPIWKILVKLDHLPRRRVNIKR